jgi:hypothetical protein
MYARDSRRIARMEWPNEFKEMIVISFPLFSIGVRKGGAKRGLAMWKAKTAQSWNRLLNRQKLR